MENNITNNGGGVSPMGYDESKTLSNDEIIERITAWQNAGFVHPLTCINSKHPKLVPIVQGKRVVLKCPKCKNIQESIPPSIINLDPKALEEEKQRLISIGFKFTE